MRNIWPLRPSGVQDASATVAPGRATRASSLAASAWRGAKITPKQEVTRSKASSSNGQLLGVSLDELHIDARLARPAAGDLEQLGA